MMPNSSRPPYVCMCVCVCVCRFLRMSESGLCVCVCVCRFLRMSESGLFGKWKGMYWPAPSNCSTGLIFTDVGIQALALPDLVSAFLLLGLGALLAAGALLTELTCCSPRTGRRWKDRWRLPGLIRNLRP